MSITLIDYKSMGICDNVDCIRIYSDVRLVPHSHFALVILNTLVHCGTPYTATYNDQLSHLLSIYLKKYVIDTRGTAITEHIDFKMNKCSV